MIGRRLLLAALAFTATAGAARAQDPPMTGVWWGVLTAGALRLRLRLEVRADGTLSFTSVDQTPESIPGRVTSRALPDFSFTVPLVQGTFTGRRVAADRIEGSWSQGGQALPLTFTRAEPEPAPVPAFLQTPPQALTPERLQQLRAAEGVPALAAASARIGGQPHYWSTGVRLAGHTAPVTDRDLWHIGSMTKAMTATLVGRYVDAGQLRWDDTVGDLLGTVVLDMRPEYRTVTFRHLLSHRSGLPANLTTARLPAYSRFLDDPRQERRAYAREALQMAPIAVPGARFEYSNNGYVVVGAILEAKFGDPWETQIRKRLFEPLGLSSAGFGPPGRSGAVDQPIGHVRGPQGFTAAPMNGGLLDNPAALGPAGRAHMTLADVLTFLAAHRDRTSLLRPQTWDVLHTAPFGGNYAFGWIVNPNGVRWHNGSNTLFYSEMAFDRANGLIAAAAANAGDAARTVDRALTEAALAART